MNEYDACSDARYVANERSRGLNGRVALVRKRVKEFETFDVKFSNIFSRNRKDDRKVTSGFQSIIWNNMKLFNTRLCNICIKKLQRSQ